MLGFLMEGHIILLYCMYVPFVKNSTFLVRHATAANVYCIMIFQFYSIVITVFMLIERMIQLPQENSIPAIVYILLERKRLSVIIFYESN